MAKILHHAFKVEYPNLSFRLITQAEVFDSLELRRQNANALWDTGAMLSAITPELAQSLNLTPFNRIKVNGINNTSFADVVRISVGLPNGVVVQEVNVTVCSLVKDVDLLIGMNIILLGDFSISNAGGKTLFTFAVPPFETKTDLYEKTLAVNKRNHR